MHEFSAADGFVEIAESLAEMIKFVANEPSAGLFYIQQHVHNAIPNLVHLKTKVADRCREATLRTEDSEDSIAMARSMKNCGFRISKEMIQDIRHTLAVMSSTRQMEEEREGAINTQSLSFHLFRSASKKANSIKRASPEIEEPSSSSFAAAAADEEEEADRDDDLPVSSLIHPFLNGCYEEMSLTARLEDWLEGTGDRKG
ncbi:unnamed protein product [Cuscuta campestris]|uniref:Uncharacterized protein n=1 Tax=Cuscuta campestris TaxID=132261 RepID=A0A484M468_9ASTE|nr:unnamed protein product [Cuscuta campestris]